MSFKSSGIMQTHFLRSTSPGISYRLSTSWLPSIILFVGNNEELDHTLKYLQELKILDLQHNPKYSLTVESYLLNGKFWLGILNFNSIKNVKWFSQSLVTSMWDHIGIIPFVNCKFILKLRLQNIHLFSLSWQHFLYHGGNTCWIE